MSQDPTAPPEQPPQGNPGEPQQGAPQGEPAAPPSPPEPSVQELQQALAQREQAFSQQQEQYRHLQADYTRKAQALAHLTGGGVLQPAPAQDPLEPQIQHLMGKGYSRSQAKDAAELMELTVAPLRQQLNQQLQATQYQTQVDYTLREAWQKHPQVFSDPAVAQSVEQQLREFASTGGRPDEDMALNLAWVAIGRRGLQQASAPVAPAVQPNFMANGTWGPRPGYAQPAPPKQPQQQFAPEVLAYEAEMQARFAKNKK